MTVSGKSYDVIIIGAGISGTILGAILARHGQKVLILEAGSHPRFAIGESMILECSETFRMLAEAFSVPELTHYSAENCLPLIGTSHGVKRHFGFIYHRKHQHHNPTEVLQAVIPESPYSHELHIYRQDSDSFFLAVAIKYGATVIQNARIDSVDTANDGVSVATDKGHFRSNYIVDASGYQSVLAQQYDLRDYELKTHSRGLFTHMVGIPSYHQVGPRRKEYGVPFSWAEGTLHHIFDGGWLWVIPFNNHRIATNPLCSVGLMLDPRMHPKPHDMTAEEEFFSFLQQYPDIAVQFTHGKAVRDWVYTDRIQYSSKRVVGERFCLLGHAAGFIDPLFSKGLYITMSCVLVLAKQLLYAKRHNDYSLATFKPLEDITHRFVTAADVLVANSFKSWRDHRLWHMYAVLWLVGAYLELVKITVARLKLQRLRSGKNGDPEELTDEMTPGRLVGGGYPEFDRLAESVDAIMDATDTDNPQEIDRSIDRIRQLYEQAEWIPYQYRQIFRGKNHLPRHKYTHRIFLNEGGPLGKGSFREHFFEDLKVRDIAAFLVEERIRYSRWNLTRRNRSYAI